MQGLALPHSPSVPTVVADAADAADAAAFLGVPFLDGHTYPKDFGTVEVRIEEVDNLGCDSGIDQLEGLDIDYDSGTDHIGRFLDLGMTVAGKQLSSARVCRKTR